MTNSKIFFKKIEKTSKKVLTDTEMHAILYSYSRESNNKQQKEVTKMTIKEVMKLAQEYDKEFETPEHIPHYYKRHGQMIRRQYDEIRYSDRFFELGDILRKEKVFRCAECGKMCSYLDLDTYYSTFSEKYYICQECQGDDD